MLKAVVFDFDGTLVESADIKTDAFAELFQTYPEHRDAIVQYHETHAGISRYLKFQVIYRDIIKKPLSLDEERKLGNAFSDLVLGKMDTCPFVPGVIEFLGRIAGQARCFIVSGTPEDELRGIVGRRRMDKYFEGVYGSPATKPEILRRILHQYGLSPSQVLCVGDAMSDLEAARVEGVPFIGRTRNGHEAVFAGDATIALFQDYHDLESRWASVIADFGTDNRSTSR